MKKRIWLIVSLMLCCLVFAALSCSSGNNATPAVSQDFRGEIRSVSLMQEGNVEDLYPYLTSLDNDRSASWDSIWEKLRNYFKYSWHLYKVVYYTTDAHGNKIEVSGALAVPVSIHGHQIEAPMLSLQHPTQVERKYSPSALDILDPELTIPAALAFCSTGYIVAIPDYPGMGINYDVHPYCQYSLSYSVVDMIRAVEDSKFYWADNARTTLWNDTLFLMGYSEGGYATMVTAKEIQLNHSDEFTISAVAPLDGPYSLSETMRNLMVNADASYSAPYFMPYTIQGYESVYGDDYPEFNFDRDVKSEVPGYTPPEGSTYALELEKRLDGTYSGEEISDFMKLATPYEGPKSILTDVFLQEIQQASGPVYNILKENNAYNDWTPEMPMKLFHNAHDDLVPVGNADEAMAAFDGLSNVTLEKYEAYIPGLGSIHAGSLPIAYYKGFRWIDSYAYPDRKLPE
ncbi:MAG: lipase family protein [Vulcanimicrobiota bacterium]